MKAKQFFINTFKEAPAEAQIVSHQLMLRAGMIKKIAAGIYTYTPLGLKVLRKIEAIVREEMNQAMALECLMPVVQPAELWQETQRFEKFGDELLRFKDRHGNDFVIQPTSEEVVTALARADIRSYKQLPVCLYQIQTKFRDERRPRFGLMRGREFLMKDAYSFDADEAGMRQSYQNMFAAYQKIFTRLGLTFKAVDADTGAIGGVGSCEFHVLAQTGEDTLVYSNHEKSDYAANLEAAHGLLPSLEVIQKHQEPQNSDLAMLAFDTPTQKTCEAVAELLNVPLQQTIKAIVLAQDVEIPNSENSKNIENIKNSENIKDVKIYLILLRGDHQLNEIKTSKIIKNFRFATETEIQNAFNCEPGFLGPVGISIDANIHVIADFAAANLRQFICGANQPQKHLQHVNWGRDCHYSELADLRNAEVGEASPDGLGTLEFCRGIEVGHVFMLGTRYSEDMKATFLDVNGKPQALVMGCYGIGVSRIMGAAIEQNHDAKGIIWPQSIAPFSVAICPINMGKCENVREYSEALYHVLKQKGIDVVLDNRDERTGSMLADWELIGVPKRITVGDKGLKDDFIELDDRRTGEKQQINAQDLLLNLDNIDTLLKLL